MNESQLSIFQKSLEIYINTLKRLNEEYKCGDFPKASVLVEFSTITKQLNEIAFKVSGKVSYFLGGHYEDSAKRDAISVLLQLVVYLQNTLNIYPICEQKFSKKDLKSFDYYLIEFIQLAGDATAKLNLKLQLLDKNPSQEEERELSKRLEHHLSKSSNSLSSVIASDSATLDQSDDSDSDCGFSDSVLARFSYITESCRREIGVKKSSDEASLHSFAAATAATVGLWRETKSITRISRYSQRPSSVDLTGYRATGPTTNIAYGIELKEWWNKAILTNENRSDVNELDKLMNAVPALTENATLTSLKQIVTMTTKWIKEQEKKIIQSTLCEIVNELHQRLEMHLYLANSKCQDLLDSVINNMIAWLKSYTGSATGINNFKQFIADKKPTDPNSKLLLLRKFQVEAEVRLNSLISGAGRSPQITALYEKLYYLEVSNEQSLQAFSEFLSAKNAPVDTNNPGIKFTRL